MKFFKFLIIVLMPLALTSQVKSKIKRAYYDKLEHINLDKIMYYENPYTIKYHKPESTNYKPKWYWGYCAMYYPLAFDDYSKHADSFLLSNNDTQISEEKLLSYLDKFKQMKKEEFKMPFEYYYGELYFTHKKTNKQYLLLLSYRVEQEIIDFSLDKLDTLKFKINKIEREKNNLQIPFADVYDLPTFSKFFVLDKGVYKLENTNDIYNNVVRYGDENLFMKGLKFDQFNNMLKRTDNYVRSKIVDGNRIVDTVKHTPNGVVIVGNKTIVSNSKTIETKNSWSLIVVLGVLFFIILGVFLFLRKKN